MLSLFILLVGLISPGIAQERINRQQQPSEIRRQETTAQEEKPLIPELATSQEVNPEALRVAVPRECAGIRPDVQTHDVADKFAPPGNPVTLSPALAAYFSGKPLKGYDDGRVNIIFADSFRLRNCRICYATLELGVRQAGDIWTNDRVYVQGAPYSPNGVGFVYAPIWNPTTPNPKTLSFALPTAALNNYLFSTATMPTFLDVFAQDDTDFDYAKLSVWYY
jgi:hypothetical protein